MKYVTPIFLIFSALLCIGMVSADDFFAEDEMKKNVGVWVYEGQTDPIYNHQPKNQSSFQINFTVDILSSYPTLRVSLMPELYEFQGITEADILSWQWNFSDGRRDSRTTMVPISVDFDTPGEYLIQLIACTREYTCETKVKLIAYTHDSDLAQWQNNLEMWQSSVEAFLVCPFDPEKMPTLRPTPTPMPTPTKNPKIQFSTTTLGSQFKTGPVYVHPNTAVQLQVSDLEYDITQIQWDYGDGTVTGWMPADRNAKVSHTYRTSGTYRPVVTVRSTAMSFQLSSEDIDEHVVIVGGQPYAVLPLPGMSGPQADLNNDGLIDDFNGDGQINSLDVITFFDAFVRVKEYLIPVSSYDYDKNGELNLQDIVVFFASWRSLDALAMTFGDENKGL